MESPIRSESTFPSSGMTQCIDGETGTCSFSGVKEVWYGAGSKWYVAAANNGVSCTSGCNRVFGDPIIGTAKKVFEPGETIHLEVNPEKINVFAEDGTSLMRGVVS